MRRLFWLSMGVTIGVMVVRKLERMVERLMPKSVALSLTQRLHRFADDLASFATDVRAAAAEREQELRRQQEPGGRRLRAIAGDAA